MILAQLGRFASIGVLATLLHVLTALVVQSQFGASAQASNLVGFLSAFCLSYVGHARVTFGVSAANAVQFRRFGMMSIAGLGFSASITHIVVTLLGAPFSLAMLAVGTLVPVMTFVAAKYWAFAVTETERLRINFGFCLVILFGVLCYAILQDRLINHDTAWYLVATRKWLEGAVLYVDLVEVNPPLNFYLTAPAIWISDVFEMRDIQSQILFLVILMTISLLWAWTILSGATALSQRAKYFVLAGVMISLSLPYLKYYGQREHVLSILLLPYMIALVVAPHGKTSRSSEIARAVFAGVGLCLKPHFMLIPIAVALATALRDRSIRPIFSASIMTFLVMGLSYIGLVKHWHPAYLDTIVPMALQVYGAYGHETSEVIKNASPLFLGVFAILMLSVVGSQKGKSLVPILAAALACVVIYFVQWTGYGYQAKPSVALILLAAVFVLIDKDIKLFARIIAVSLFGIAAFDSFKSGFYRSPMATELDPVLNASGPERRLAVFSSSLWPGFPLVLHADGVWTSRYPALWLIPGAVNALASENCKTAPQSCANYVEILDQTRNNIVADFIEGHADTLIVDKRPFYIRDADFNYIEFLSELEGFQQRFDEYEISKSSDKFDVYVRREP
jgi:putative flippase GtrA